MVEIIAGEKGKGKTKCLLDKVNDSLSAAKGNIVFIDKSQQHIFELNTKVRLIDVTDYPTGSCAEFVGFVLGILSQDHDIETMYLDSLITIAHMKDDEIAPAIERLEMISEKYQVDFVVSISKDSASLPKEVQSRIVLAL